MSSFPLFGAPAPSPVATAPIPGRSSPVVGRVPEPIAVIPNIERSSTTISGNIGATFNFAGITGYTVSFEKYNEIFGTVVSPTGSRAASPSAFTSRQTRPSRASTSPVPFTADSAAAAALRATPP